ncbi:MAG: TonB-dependent receptor [Pseudomonadota bacterium]|jgi:Outer membrane cobalamin receptor protein
MSIHSSPRGRICGALSVCLCAIWNQASGAEEPDVLVTASRIPERIDETLWSATVLTRADIESSQASSLQELLASVAGIDIDNAGGLGKATTVFMRGAESDHTLLLVDGLRIGSATLGLPPFEHIPMEQIERVEIVRGPRSVLYGSDAVGGVIQVFTRDAGAPGFDVGASLSGGSHDTRHVAAHIGGRGARGWLRLGAESLDTNGFNSCSGSLEPPGGCYTFEPDDDGFRSRTGTLNAGVRLGESVTAELRALAVDGRTEYDGTFTNMTEIGERAASLHVGAALGSAWRLRAAVGHSVDEQENFIDGSFQSRFDTKRDTASVQIEGSVASRLRLIAGVDYQDDRIDSTTQYARTSRGATGVFGELRASFEHWSVLGGLRVEDNEQFGSHVVGNVGIARSLGSAHRLTASWGTAFHMPTFNELYFPDGIGNPALAPEESESLELGVDGARGRLRWSVHAFQTDFDELIAFDLTSFTSLNVAEARIRGAELQADWRGAGWRVGGHVTLLDAENLSEGADRGKRLPRRARTSAALEVRRTWAHGALGARARWEGARYNELSNDVRLGGFLTVDLLAEQSLGSAWTVQARVTNLLDRRYSTSAFFEQDGRNFGVTLRYRLASR